MKSKQTLKQTLPRHIREENRFQYTYRAAIVIVSNSPIICAVLALDSWNYCSGEQARQPNICKIPQSSLYSSTIVHKTKQNKVLPPYVNSPCHKVADAGNSTSS